MRQSRSVPSSPMAGGAQYGGAGGAQYGGKLGKGGKTVMALNVASGKARDGKSDNVGGSGGKCGSGGKNDNADAAASKTPPAAKKTSEIPPPPLVGLHFPALGGDDDEEDKPKSQLQHRPKDVAATAAADGETPQDTAQAKNLDGGAESNADKKPAPAPSAPPAKKEADSAAAAPSEVPAKKPLGGYAAALMKSTAPAAPAAWATPAPTPTVQKVAPPVSAGGESPDVKKVRHAECLVVIQFYV